MHRGDVRRAVREAARVTYSRAELEHRHRRRLAEASPQIGSFDGSAVERRAAEDPDDTLALLADLANATDATVRAQARRLAARLLVRFVHDGAAAASGPAHMMVAADPSGELDLDRTLARTGGARPWRPDDIVTRSWQSKRRSLCLLIDRSGSMSGRGVALAAMGAAVVLMASRQRAGCSIVAFAKDALVLQAPGRERDVDRVVSDILSLRGSGVTDLALALRAAQALMAAAPAGERVVLLLSDVNATTGDDPMLAVRGIDRLHVLGTSTDPSSVEAGRRLARVGHGSYRTCSSITQLPLVLAALLGERGTATARST